jgi:Amt family ammonium transporter
MIPGLGYFYSGLARHKNALSLIFLSMLSLAVGLFNVLLIDLTFTVSIQWFFFGYTLAFSPTGGPFIGTFQNAFYLKLFDDGNMTYPDILTIPGSAFMVYQGMFAVRPTLLTSSH